MPPVDDLASAFARSTTLNHDRVASDEDAHALARAFSVPKDFNEILQSKSSVELRRCIVDDDAFDDLLRSTRSVKESTAFARDLASEIERLSAECERLERDAGHLAGHRAVVENGDLREAEEAYGRVREEVIRRQSTMKTLPALVADARAFAMNLEEQSRADVARATRSKTKFLRDALDDLIERLVERQTRAHRVKLIASIVDPSD